MRETLDLRPDCRVDEAEYRRLLGFPPGYAPGERARELAAGARRWFAEHGLPWVYLREAALETTAGALRIEDVAFDSKPLHELLLRAGARRVALVAASAGGACEDQARRLWEEGKPDEYFFLEVYGSAAVEHLVAAASGRICDLAERDGLMAVPHYSPGYAGWDVADQPRLFDLIARGRTQPWPGPLAVLPSGMLRPKKSLLAVFGLTARTAEALAAPRLVPCESCSFAPCRYRRAPHRPGPTRLDGAPAPVASRRAAGSPLAPDPPYSVNPRALRKWAGERVRIERRADGSIAATFRFDGTTCTNLGQPLAFEYRVALGAPADGYPILAADCRPAPGDEGNARMCAYLTEGPALLRTIAAGPPLVGRPLDEVFAWSRPPAPAGCYCQPESRAHKWGLALEAIHFALARGGAETRAAPAPVSTLP
jgi:hypothetical protein